MISSNMLKKILGVVLLSAATCASWAAPATTYLIYDEAGHVIGEYDANGNAVQEHVYLGDRPVAVVQTTTSDGAQSSTVDYVSTDQLNTPRVVTDQNQAVLWTWNSDPFGNGNPTGSLTYNLRFPGQYADAETGHNYNYYRDYNASIGRYVESDPIGLRGGPNTFSYASQNPISLTDPSGLIVMIVGHIAAGALGKLTYPWSYHTALYLQPNDPCHCSGNWPMTLGAQKMGGLLGVAINYPGDALSNAQYVRVVKPPAGKDDCEFIRDLIAAAASYQDNLDYSFPILPTGDMPAGQYNSNSFVSGVIGAAGGTPPPLTGPFQTPGYQNPIPLPPQH